MKRVVLLFLLVSCVSVRAQQFVRGQVGVQAGFWFFPRAVLSGSEKPGGLPLRSGLSVQPTLSFALSSKTWLGITYNYGYLSQLAKFVTGCELVTLSSHTGEVFIRYLAASGGKLTWEHQYGIQIQRIAMSTEPFITSNFCNGNEITINNDAWIFGISLTNGVAWQVGQRVALTFNFRTTIAIFGQRVYQYPVQFHFLLGTRYSFGKTTQE